MYVQRGSSRFDNDDAIRRIFTRVGSIYFLLPKLSHPFFRLHKMRRTAF